MKQKETILLIGQPTEAELLIKAAFASSFELIHTQGLAQLKKFTNRNRVKAVITDGSQSAIDFIKKVRTEFNKKQLAIFSALAGKIDSANAQQLEKNTNGVFNIQDRPGDFIRHLGNQQPAPKREKRKISRKVGNLYLKRAFDILLSGTALLLLSPVFLLVMLAIRLEDKGPSIYLSKRVGSNYRVFKLIKFRTMYTDADKRLGNLKNLNMYAADKEVVDLDCCGACGNSKQCAAPLVMDGKVICEAQYQTLKAQEDQGVFLKFKNDPRITKVGRFLRNTSIDELPQLYNVFLGHMSLVGNRPLPLYEAEKLTSDGKVLRFLAPAGLTGLWQVTQRGKEVSTEERIALDNEYAERFSFLFDIKIIFKTFPALLQQENV